MRNIHIHKPTRALLAHSVAYACKHANTCWWLSGGRSEHSSRSSNPEPPPCLSRDMAAAELGRVRVHGVGHGGVHACGHVCLWSCMFMVMYVYGHGCLWSWMFTGVCWVRCRASGRPIFVPQHLLHHHGACTCSLLKVLTWQPPGLTEAVESDLNEDL